MAVPRTERAIRAIVVQLQTILVANNYHTNAGTKVCRARRSFTKPDCPALSVFFVSKTPKDGTALATTFNVEIAIDAHVAASQSETGEKLGLLMADVEQCLGAWDCAGGPRDDDGSLGALKYDGATAESRPDGAETEAVSLKYTVVLMEAKKDPAKKAPRE